MGKLGRDRDGTDCRDLRRRGITGASWRRSSRSAGPHTPSEAAGATYARVDTSTGTVRIARHCHQSERAVTWAKTGPQGPAGPSDGYSATGDRLASVTVPTGYLATGGCTARLRSPKGGTIAESCHEFAGGPRNFLGSAVPLSSFSTFVTAARLSRLRSPVVGGDRMSRFGGGLVGDLAVVAGEFGWGGVDLLDQEVQCACDPWGVGWVDRDGDAVWGVVDVSGLV